MTLKTRIYGWIFIYMYKANDWVTGKYLAFSNYWMRLSRIWRILQIKEGVIHKGRMWITPSLICRILHILRKPNSITVLLFIQNISSFLKEFRHYTLCFSVHQNNTTLSPGFLGQRFNNLQQAGLFTSFWRHRFNNFWQAALLKSLIQYGKDSFQIGEQQLVTVNYACGFHQSETRKYFEWIIIYYIILCRAMPQHWTAMHCTKLHYTALHYTTLHYITTLY